MASLRMNRRGRTVTTDLVILLILAFNGMVIQVFLPWTNASVH